MSIHPIYRLSSQCGRVRIYNTANHPTVKDEASARAAVATRIGRRWRCVTRTAPDSIPSASTP